jgi:hypothetical protein
MDCGAWSTFVARRFVSRDSKAFGRVPEIAFSLLGIDKQIPAKRSSARLDYFSSPENGRNRMKIATPAGC